MSIASAIVNKQQQIADCYTAISNKGGTLPVTQNVANMPTAISSIPSGGSGTITSLNVTPTTSAQTITASGGVDGYSPVNVSAVTSSIDSNIQPENIRNGVTILGVRGIYSATPSNFELLHQGYSYYVEYTGKYEWADANDADVNDVEIRNVSELHNGDSSMALIAYNTGYAVSNARNPKLYSRNVWGNIYVYDVKLIATDNSTTTYPYGALYFGFSNTRVEGIIFYDLETISVTVSLGARVTANPLWHLVDGAVECTTVEFNKLSTISLVAQGTSSSTYPRACLFDSWFANGCGVTDVYFHSLTTTSFQGDGSAYTFYSMFSNAGSSIVRTLHFPSNLQSTISGLQGYPLFGGTSGYVVLAFDLTATE